MAARSNSGHPLHLQQQSAIDVSAGFHFSKFHSPAPPASGIHSAYSPPPIPLPATYIDPASHSYRQNPSALIASNNFSHNYQHQQYHQARSLSVSSTGSRNFSRPAPMLAQAHPVDHLQPSQQMPLMGNTVSRSHEKQIGITRKPVQQQVDSGQASPMSDHQPNVQWTAGPGYSANYSASKYANDSRGISGTPGPVNDLPVGTNPNTISQTRQPHNLSNSGSHQQALGTTSAEAQGLWPDALTASASDISLDTGLAPVEKDLLALEALSIHPHSVQQHAQIMPEVAIYHVGDKSQPQMHHDGMPAQFEYMGEPGQFYEDNLEQLPQPRFPNQYPPPPQRFHPQDHEQLYGPKPGPGLEVLRSVESLPRPHSTNTLGSSSNSDGARQASHAGHLSVGGQTPSPMASPMLRPQNRHSPEHRPQSYIDLLQTPYAQQVAPSPNFDNSLLRQVVGKNASLMEASKTMEAYRANVKNIPDPAIQYEFAVFMVQTALELDPEAPGPVHRDGLIRDARQILQKLVDKSYPFAQYYLADGYASGLFNKGKEDYDRAFPLFQAAAKRGHAEAAYRAALCYELGWGCRKDYNKAVKFYEMSASKNHPGAATRLGLACLNDMMGLSNKYREGCKWLKRAAESADAQYNAAPYELAKLHENGFGPDIFKDEAYAAQLFTESANLGHPDANLVMGKAYEHGYLGCPQDAMLSIHFYTGAAQSGEPEGMMALCAWYLFGAPPLLEKDDYEAFEWAKRAADFGYGKAEYAVGYFKEMGIGCNQDTMEANHWYWRAAQQGDSRAKERMKTIEKAVSGAGDAPGKDDHRAKKGFFGKLVK